MEIKGVYNEKTYKKEKDKEYGPDKYFIIASKTAGQFLQETKEEKVPYYVFRPRKTLDEVKEEFLRGLKAKASVDFYNSAVKTIRVIRQYFPVNYIDVHSVADSNLVETRHYKPSGEYSIDGKLEGDTLKVDVSQGSTYSHSTYERETTTKYVNQKKYYNDISGPLHRFSKKLFETNEVDESALIPAEELMKDAMFSYTSPRYILGRDASYNLLQVLLFPIWRVECDFNGHTYVNYVSDVANSEIVYLELSQEEQTKIIEEKRKKEFEDTHGMGSQIGQYVNYTFVKLVFA